MTDDIEKLKAENAALKKKLDLLNRLNDEQTTRLLEVSKELRVYQMAAKHVKLNV